MRQLAVMLAIAAVACLAPRASAAAASVLALADSRPELAQGLRLIRSNSEELAAYLEDPGTVCTVFLPTNEAMTTSIKRLGKFAGLAAQNKTLQETTFNYHVIPGQALTAQQLGAMGSAPSRANEPLGLWTINNTTHVFSNPAYPIPLEAADIKAGGCIVHSIGTALIPPSAQTQLNAWLDELGTLPPPLPVAQQPPALQGMPEAGSAAAQPAAIAAPAAPATATSGASLASANVLAAAGVAVLALLPGWT